MKRKKQKCLRIIYARYIFPLTLNIALAISLFIPCIKFTLDGKARESISLYTNFINSWNESRNYLFSSATKSTPTEDFFFKTVFITLTVTILLACISLAIDIFSLIYGIRYIGGNGTNNAKKAKNIYTTLIPNRVILILFKLLCIPLLAFPQMLVLIYQKASYTVSVGYTSLLPMIIYALFLTAMIGMMFFSKKHETRLDLDIFEKNKKLKEVTERATSTPTDTTEEPKIYHMSEKSAEEQRQRLMSLLGYDENENQNDSKEND